MANKGKADKKSRDLRFERGGATAESAWLPASAAWGKRIADPNG